MSLFSFISFISQFIVAILRVTAESSYVLQLTACAVSFLPKLLASWADADTPCNRVDEEEACESGRFALSLSLFLSLFLSLGSLPRTYTGKEQSLLSTTREIGSSVQSETRARIINPRTRTHTRAYTRARGWPLSGGNYRNANWPV